jgi:hypothetical protein
MEWRRDVEGNIRVRVIGREVTKGRVRNMRSGGEGGKVNDNRVMTIRSSATTKGDRGKRDT